MTGWIGDKYRHLIEKVFARLKHFGPVARRENHLKRNYQSMLVLAGSIIWLLMYIVYRPLSI